MGTFSRTWRLMRASWEVLKKDKELLVFPLLSSIAALLVMGTFAMPLLDEGVVQYLSRAGENDPVVYLWLFLFYFGNSVVVIFFNAAIVACALARMNGKDPTLRFGLQMAWQRLSEIILWALATSTVGFLLRVLEDRFEFVGRLVVAMLGMAWSVTSFLVVPVLVHKGKGPVGAYKESASMLKRSWGEQITGSVSFALLYAALGLPPVAVVLGIALTGNLLALGAAIAGSVVYLVLLALVQSTLQAIYQAAVYCYASAGAAPSGFDERMLAGTFRQK